MYFAFVRTKQEYGDILVIWSNLSKTLVFQVELIQKWAGRIVSGAVRGTSRDVIYHELGWDTIIFQKRVS